MLGHRDCVFEVTNCDWGINLIGTASADRTARIWSVDGSLSDVLYVGHQGAVNSIRYHPVSRIVCTASGDSSCHLWKPPLHHTKVVSTRRTAATPEKKRFSRGLKTKLWSPVLDRNEELSDEAEQGRKIFDSAAAHQSPSEHGSPDQKENAVSLTLTRAPTIQLKGHKGPVSAADWLNDGANILSAAWDQTLRIWDVERGTQIREYLLEKDESIIPTNVTTHEKIGVVSTSDGHVQVWDTRKQVPAVNIEAHEGAANTAMKAGTFLFSGGDDRVVRVWDTRNLKQAVNTIRCSAGVNRFSVSKSSSTMAIPLDDSRTKLCDVSGNRLGTLRSHAKGVHTSMISGTAWSTDESVVYTSSCDRIRSLVAWTRDKPREKDKKREREKKEKDK